MAKTRQTQKKRTASNRRGRGAVRVRRAAAAGYVAGRGAATRGTARDAEITGRINDLVADGVALRREIEDRIEARLRERAGRR